MPEQIRFFALLGKNGLTYFFAATDIEVILSKTKNLQVPENCEIKSAECFLKWAEIDEGRLHVFIMPRHRGYISQSQRILRSGRSKYFWIGLAIHKTS